MQSDDVLYLGKATVMMIFYLSMPTIVVATTVGLLVALVQTLIQLQEQTLGFAMKLAAVIAVFFFLGDQMSNEIMNFQEQIFDRIAQP
jgi:type III secretion protein S